MHSPFISCTTFKLGMNCFEVLRISFTLRTALGQIFLIFFYKSSSRSKRIIKSPLVDFIFDKILKTIVQRTIFRRCTALLSSQSLPTFFLGCGILLWSLRSLIFFELQTMSFHYSPNQRRTYSWAFFDFLWRDNAFLFDLPANKSHFRPSPHSLLSTLS